MRAFTLIESLLYIALFGLLLQGAVAGVSAITETAGRNQARTLLETEGGFLVSKITYDIDHSESISAPTLYSSTATLQTISDTGTSVTIQRSGTFLIRTESALSSTTDTEILSSNAISVDSISFALSPDTYNSLAPAFLQIELQISASSSSGRTISQHFSSIAYPPL